MLGNINNSKSISFQVDDYFSKQSSTNQKLLYGVGALVAGYIAWSLVSPITQSALDETKRSLKSMQQKLKKTNEYLASHSDAKLRKLKQTIAAKKRQYDNVIYKISYVDNKLNELNYLLFNDESWANFVDKISELGKKYSVDIKEINNRFYDPSFKKISHVVEVDVKSKAKVKDMIKFLNAIEESQLVIDVNNIKMQKPGEGIESEFKIAVWGMKY